MRKWLALFVLFCGFMLGVEGTVTLSPEGPAYEVISSMTIGTTVQPTIANSGTSAGFLLLCADGNDNLNTVFFDNNTQMWGSLVQTAPSTTNLTRGPVVLSNSPSVAVATWLGNTVGFNSGYAYAGFTSNNGTSWQILPLESVDGGVPLVGVSGSSDGYMFVWFDYQQSTAPFWLWSTFNGTDWVVSSSGTIPAPSGINNPANVSGTMSTGFMAAWIGSDNNVYASYTGNEGGTWSTPQQLSTSGIVRYSWIAGNANGFMLVWSDGANNLYSTFYDLSSQMWQASPLLITTGAAIGSIPGPYVTGSDIGFVLSWLDTNNNANGSISADNGTNWSPAVLITDDGSVSGTSGNLGDYIGASIVGETVLFTWADASGNAQSRFYTIQGVITTPDPPASITGSQFSNNFPFQRELVNTLRWTSSPSLGVVSYNIYRNGSLISSVSASGSLVYTDRPIKKGTGYTYGVTAVNINQQESSAATVFVK